MRCLIVITAAVVATFGAGSLSITAADAMPMVGAQGLSVVPAMTQQVDLVYRRAWNGYRWVRSCYETSPRYYESGSSYYYGGGPSIYFGSGGLGFPHHHHHHHHFGYHGHHGHHGPPSSLMFVGDEGARECPHRCQ